MNHERGKSIGLLPNHKNQEIVNLAASCYHLAPISFRIIEIMLQFWTEEEITPESLSTVMRILSYSDIIEFFSYEKDTESSLEAKIVSSLINPGLFCNVISSICNEYSFDKRNSGQFSALPKSRLEIELEIEVKDSSGVGSIRLCYGENLE